MKKLKENLIKVELIENYIKENKITVKEFCARCKIGYDTYKRIMAGSNFMLSALFKIAREMGKDIHLLFKNKIPQI